MSDDKLKEWRNEIDLIDANLLTLLNERYEYVQKIGEWKAERGLPVYVPERERALLKKLEEMEHPLLPDSALRAIFREIISGARQLEQPFTVAYLGPQGTFSHMAAMRRFGHSAEYQATHSIAEVFREVECERAEFGCVPIENSTEGTVNYTLDMLMSSELSICEEVNLRIHHSLLSNYALEEIRVVYSHPQILGQCRDYLLRTLPEADLIEVASSTAAAERAAQEKYSAALANALAGELFSLPVLAENVEDYRRNCTRFLVLGRQLTVPTGDDKTSICFVVKDRPGVLYDSLAPLKAAGLTMTMIESRPVKTANWQYCFFIDLLGHRNDPFMSRAFAELEKYCSMFKVLGSYPRAREEV